MEVTKALLSALRTDIDAALAEVGRKHGVTLNAGNASYDPAGSFHFKLLGQLLGAPSKDEIRYDREHGWLKLPPRGSSVVIGRVEYKTWGLNSTASKVIMQRADGKKFLYATDVIARISAVAVPERAAG